MSARSMLGSRRSPLSGSTTIALAAALVLALSIAASCASPHRPHDTSRAPVEVPVVVAASQSATIDPKIVRAQTEALAAYSGYINAETTASQTADYGSPELSKYASDPLLGQWIAELFHLHVIGDVQRGTVVSHPSLVSLKLSKTSGTAIVRDCLDQSQISIVNAATGKPIKLPKQKPYLATATIYLYSNGAWLVSRVDTSQAKPC